MSTSGRSRWYASSRGISHIEVNEAKVGHAHHPPPARAADLAHAGVQPLECRQQRAQQQGAVGRQLDMAGAAKEQGRADFLFERLDLAADGRLGEEQLLGRFTKAQPPRDRLEGTQVADGERALAGIQGRDIHSGFASKRGRDFIGWRAECRR